MEQKRQETIKALRRLKKPLCEKPEELFDIIKFHHGFTLDMISEYGELVKRETQKTARQKGQEEEEKLPRGWCRITIERSDGERAEIKAEAFYLAALGEHFQITTLGYREDSGRYVYNLYPAIRREIEKLDKLDPMLSSSYESLVKIGADFDGNTKAGGEEEYEAPTLDEDDEGVSDNE